MRFDYHEELQALPFDPELKIMVGKSYGGDYSLPPVEEITECFMTNYNAPKIREGWGRFKSCYEVEWYYCGYHYIDTARSLVGMLEEITLDGRRDSSSRWPACDCVGQLVSDLRFTERRKTPPTKAEEMMYTTILPVGLSEFLRHSYIACSLPERVHTTEPRVINNPLFYQDRNAPMGRLVEIAGEHGRIWALDRAKPIPTPEVLADEIASLCYALTNPKRLPVARAILLETITEQMDLYALTPNL